MSESGSESGSEGEGEAEGQAPQQPEAGSGDEGSASGSGSEEEEESEGEQEENGLAAFYGAKFAVSTHNRQSTRMQRVRHARTCADGRLRCRSHASAIEYLASDAPAYSLDPINPHD